MFDFAEVTKEMSAIEILNYYRNLYYAEPQVTERGIIANAINDYLTSDVQEVRHGKWMTDRFGLEVAICSICRATYEGGDSFRFCPKCGAKMDLEELQE